MPEQHFENYQGPPRAVSCAKLPFVLSLIVYTLSHTFGVVFFFMSELLHLMMQRSVTDKEGGGREGGEKESMGRTIKEGNKNHSSVTLTTTRQPRHNTLGPTRNQNAQVHQRGEKDSQLSSK